MAQRVVIPGFRKIESGGSGEGGTNNYNDLTNKPSINNVPLVGNLRTANLKLTDATLTEEGVPAEAKTVGAKLAEQSASLTALSEQLGNHTVKSDVPENAVFTDTLYNDTGIKSEIDKKADTTSIPRKVSELTNDRNYQTAEQVNNTVVTEISKVVADAPEDFDTLKEMSDWIAGHEDDASAMNSAISDNKTAITELQSGKADKSEIPKTLPADGGNADTVNNHTVKSDVPENAVFTDTIYDDTDIKEEIANINSNLSASNAGAHNSVYRGKYLGNALTTEQKAQISEGTFNDLYIGDYWTIDEVNYRIAAFDYWLNSGDIQCTKHHVVIVPDTCLYNTKMNTTNTTTGAYIGSETYKTNLEQAKTTINNAFGSANILSHREYLPNATKATADPTYEIKGSWYDSTVELMNERMVYGADIFHNIEVNGAIPTNYTIDKSQLPLFALEPSRICNRANWWLRDVVSAAYFASVNTNGYASCTDASYSYGVRPAFAIKG